MTAKGHTSSSLFDGCSVLSLPPQYESTTRLPFPCNGRQAWYMFLVNEKISLHGFGFLGPIDGDTHFEVTVQIKRKENDRYTYDSGTLQKNIFARKGEMFYFLLDKPIVVEASASHSSCGNRHDLFFSLKGRNNVSQYETDQPKAKWFEASGVQIRLFNDCYVGSPLAELLFKKI